MSKEKEVLIEIRVKILEAVSVEGGKQNVVMIPFTAEASGPYFTGKVIGPGVDTQRIEKDGLVRLSARYMLEGKDSAGNACRVFIENQGSWNTGFTPTVVTDSPVLAFWETAKLSAMIEGIDGGVLVRIMRADPEVPENKEKTAETGGRD